LVTFTFNMSIWAFVSESQCIVNNAPPFRSPLVDWERMWPVDDLTSLETVPEHVSGARAEQKLGGEWAKNWLSRSEVVSGVEKYNGAGAKLGAEGRLQSESGAQSGSYRNRSEHMLCTLVWVSSMFWHCWMRGKGFLSERLDESQARTR